MKLKLFLVPVICLFAACVDSVDPAGPAQYLNPEYPSDLRGYALIPSTFSDVFFSSGRVFTLDRTGQFLLSFSATDPNLAIPESLVVKDTLQLGLPPGQSVFHPESGVLFMSHDAANDIYRLDDIQNGTPVLLYACQSIVTDLFMVDQGDALLICYLGPEWIARKIDAVTGEELGEYSTGWPITRATVSPDGTKALLSNSGMEYLTELNTETMQPVSTIPMPERIGPFLYNSSGNIVVFNQYSIHPRVYLIDGGSGDILQVINSINPYKSCSLVQGTDIVLAPRRSDNRISVLNSENMIFAPSIFCFNYAESAFAANNGENIIVASDSPGRIYIYEFAP